MEFWNLWYGFENLFRWNFNKFNLKEEKLFQTNFEQSVLKFYFYFFFNKIIIYPWKWKQALCCSSFRHLIIKIRMSWATNIRTTCKNIQIKVRKKWEYHYSDTIRFTPIVNAQPIIYRFQPQPFSKVYKLSTPSCLQFTNF